MTASNREAGISKTLTYEGGYTNHPSDPGGPTNWGITIADARMYWRKNATAADVKAMPKQVAIAIYRAKYWAKMGCDEQPAGPDFVDFDFGVNSGVARALKYRAALAPRKLSPVAYVKAQCAKRRSFLQGLRTWSVFGKGWGRRVADVEAFGVKLALAAQGKPVEPTLKKEAKAAGGKATASTGAATGTAASPASLPDLSSIDTTTKIGLAVLAVVVALGLAFFIWHAVHNAHRKSAYGAQLSET